MKVVVISRCTKQLIGASSTTRTETELTSELELEGDHTFKLDVAEHVAFHDSLQNEEK